MDNYKIIYVANSLKKGGGIQEVLTNMYNVLYRNNIIADFILLSDNESEIEDIMKNNGSKIFRLDSINNNSRIHKYFSIAKVIRKISNYNIVHINLSCGSDAIYALIVKIVSSSKVIVHAHGNNCGNKYLFILVRLILNLFADGYASCSIEAAKWYFGETILENEKKFRVIPNFFDVLKFKFNIKTREAIRRKYDIDNKIVLGIVGRLSEGKNHKFALRVLKKLVDNNNKNYVMLIVGEGDFKDNIVKLAEELKIIDKVIFTGIINDVYKMYNAMDMFLFPSKSEGLGNSLIEAQYSGLKCISSDKVPMLTNISENVVYLSIDKDESELLWSKHIENTNYIYDHNVTITNSIFDIKKSSEILLEFYKHFLK